VAKRLPTDPLPKRDDLLVMWRSCLSTSLRRTERLVTRHYDSYLEEAGITAVQLPILSIIASVAEPTFRSVSGYLELERSTLSRNLAVLQKLGLVDLGPSSGPKPGLISLTKKGREALRAGRRQWQKAHRALVARMEPGSLDEGLRFLKQLRATVRGTRSPNAGPLRVSATKLSLDA
jgi:DNA-binding MarR family transcriptional regulator